MNTNSLPILLVIDHFGSGGAQRQIVNIANGLIEAGEDVHVFIYYPHITHYKSFLDSKAIVHEVKKRGRYDLSGVFFIFKLLYKYNYKSAMAFLNTPAFYLEIASLFYFRKLNMVYSERTSLGLISRSLPTKLKRSLHHLCSFVTSNSIVQTEYLKDIYGKEKVVYIPNAVPDVFFQKKNVVVKREFTVLAHTTPFKNFMYVAEALVEYKKQFKVAPPTVNWYGRKEISPELEQTEKLLEAYDIKDSLVFHGPVSNVCEVLEASFFLIHPSKFESSANAVIEALSSSTPVLLGNLVEHREIVNQSSAGMCFDLAKPSELSKLMFEVIKLDSDAYSKLCDNAYVYSRANYRCSIVVKKYMDLLC
ncbi:glycosyltransferase family 4 protein [Shewanella algae]|uniref:glycosyltransferase family 4 protein n=1 Tax=Shewanella algae TaxID=38313 RepID=UPI001AAD8970|nr:glycosyltransferase family 4 protein [Shewanella algae]MBO2657668.1 glycosyltransferase family 4 protein [Shewanella algae]